MKPHEAIEKKQPPAFRWALLQFLLLIVSAIEISYAVTPGWTWRSPALIRRLPCFPTRLATEHRVGKTVPDKL